MSREETYRDPLVERYASPEMARIFSAETRYRIWRRLWVALAEAQAELGLPIRPEQIEALRRHAEEIDFRRVAEIEHETRHDVMAHLRAFAEQCPEAGGVLHLGATSAFVTDNADVVLLREALRLVRRKLLRLLARLRDFALAYKDLPCLAYTHFQPAQLTTVGKRAALWAQDFLLDFEEVDARLRGLRFRGVKGTTGTQASYLRLFDGDGAKVRELDRRVAEKMGFTEVFPITGQTYPRKQDDAVLHALSGVAQSVHKATNDLRLLQGLGELEEPFGERQVGSSAMPYKRNPMRLERAASLAKYVVCCAQNPPWIQATQWFERTLDDSANRRLSIPQAFLATDAMLALMIGVFGGVVVYPEVIRRRLEEELPFMASENLMMLAVKAGGNRQELHECIRRHAMEVAEARRRGEIENDLLERLRNEPLFAPVKDRFGEALDPARYVGRAPEQVEEFFAGHVDPLLAELPAEDSDTWEAGV